ncbi:MAG TPA: hypothetical protein VFD92_08350 [Candidatus Binatia bacterium]|nr:hypothetical protein [Candidatus Binatia bacterium]
MVRGSLSFRGARACLALAAVALISGPDAARGTELVRVRISQFTGAEPLAVDSATSPQLFALDGAIASAELRAANPLGEFKGDLGPATFEPSLAPAPPAIDPGTIELVITPHAGSPIAPGGIRFQTASPFANPTSLVLRWSKDDFATALSVIDMAATTVSVVPLSATASDEEIVLRWVAGNDFGEFGGGEAGFAGDDIVVATDASFPPGGCDAAPATTCLEPGKAAVKLMLGKTPASRSAAWSWTKGSASPTDVGDPTATTGYRLCVYADGVLVMGEAIPPGSACGNKPCWKKIGGGGFSYADRTGRADGITALTVKPGDGNALVRVRGRGQKLLLPAFPLTAFQNVKVQLVRADAPVCWNASFAPPAQKSTTAAFADALP